MNPLTQGGTQTIVPMAAAPSDPRAVAAKAAAFASIDEALGHEVDFLRALVGHSSTRGQTNGVQHLVAGTLREMGLRVDEVTVERERIARLPGFSPADWPYDGLFQVVGTLPAAGSGGTAGTGGRSLLLNGHVDVVSAEPVAHWTHNPWAGEVAGGRMYGRGTGDMKAGIAAMIYALQAVQVAGIGLRGDVLVETVFDEECGGNGTLALLAQGYRADAAVAHPLNYNVGVIQGGDWPSSVPEACTLEVRFACYPGEDLDVVQARFHHGVLRVTAADDWLREHPPELAFFGFRGEGAVYDLESDVVRTVAANHAQVLGTPLRVGVSTASDDRRFFQLYHGIPAVCYGPIGGQIHAVDEWVDLESLRVCTRVLAGVLIDWCGVA